MLEEDDAGNAFYFGSDPPKTLLTPSAPMTASMYSSQFDDDDDPWASAITVDPVADMARSLSRQAAMNRTSPDRLLDVDEIMANSATASSALAGVQLPTIYETAFAHANPSDGKVTLQALNRVLSLGGINPYMVDKIIGLVVPRDASYVTKSEFNAAIALLALSQKNVDVSIHSLSRHRNDLPLPILYGLEDLIIKQQPGSDSQPDITTAEEDPWKTVVPVQAHSNGLDPSPSYQRPVVNDKPDPVRVEPKEPAPTKPQRAPVKPKPVPPPEPAQTKKPTTPPPPPAPSPAPAPAPARAPAPAPVSTPAMEPPSPKSSPSPSSPAPSPNVVRPVVSPSAARPRTRGSTDNYQWFLDRDLVKVNVAPEKEGFLFKHTNYVVESQQRSSVVLRRYSDFWWLWETLLKRYPFRILPNLPPKKLGGMDAVFLDKRRKGLTRFVNFLVCHPTLSQDEVVEKFLSEPSELLAWRRQHPPSTDEEFIRINPNVMDIEPQVPLDLVERLTKVGGTMNSSIEHYRNMCFTVERMIKRSEAQANDYIRYSDSLRSLSETSQHCYLENCEECGRVAHGCLAVAEHIQKASNIVDDKCVSATNGILENLKRHRDLLVSFKELLDRKEKLAVNQIDGLNKRIAMNQTKVNQNRGVPGLEHEVERIDAALKTDREDLQYQTRRQIYIQYCMYKELEYLHKQQGFVSVMYQNFVNDQIKFSQLALNNWKHLEEPVYQMPADVQ
ncbi:hypothetical protein INT43_008968 [Umbelopsis isabellina]|uniref:Sorting nexin MVP1 n=1 Tax=Mortierella isabellina TaxID=91625 RepID=A0A8H7UFR7_MORIS|nr:hypothetical protein INT43_008968 [Umbelopsis isabellina]